MTIRNVKLKNRAGEYLQPYTENLPTASTSTAGKVKLDSSPTSGSNNAITSGAVYSALNLKANDSAVAHKSGSETFTGVKTLQAGNDDGWMIKKANGDYTEAAPAAQVAGAFRVTDKNNKIMGDVRFIRTTAGLQTATLMARNAVTGSEVNCSISCNVDKTGKVYTAAPTPAASDNSTKIATTSWVTTKINNVINSTSGNRNIGEIIASTVPLTDAGLHLLDGATIQGDGSYAAFVTYMAGLVSTYPKCFTTETTWQNTVNAKGVCGKFVYNSSANTIRLPKITGFIEGTVDTNALGDLVDAGLPNITGSFNGLLQAESDAGSSGAFTHTLEAGGEGGDRNGSPEKQVTHLDASRSSSIYGNSSTVQPQAIKVFYYIVVATSAKTNIEVNLDNVVSDLNNKVDISQLADCEVVVETYRNGTQWYRLWSDGWIEQGGYLYVSSNGQTLSFMKQFQDINYTITAAGTEEQRGNVAFYNRAINSCKCWTSDDETFNAAGINWTACGY